jgi:signal transduction histidine kinase
VREIAEAHGGTVSAEEAPGGGALLRLRLPTSHES